MAAPTRTSAGELAAQLIIGAVRDAVETVRDRQVDGAQCHPNPDYRQGWIAACEQLLSQLEEAT